MRTKNFSCIAICTILTLAGGTNALADDTEVFFGTSSGEGANVLFIMDTSGSMDTNDIPTATAAYDASTTYSASGCSGSRIYYKAASSTSAISCSSNYISSSIFFCNDATATALASDNGYQDAAVRWRSSSSGMGSTNYSWTDSLGSNYTDSNFPVACKGHSDDSTDTQFPRSNSTTTSTSYWNGTLTSNYWTVDTSNTAYKFYSGNYVAYLATASSSTIKRITAAKNAAKAVLTDLYNNNSNVNVGLMRYDSDSGIGTDPRTSTEGAEGGMIIEAVQPLTSTSLASFTATIDGLKTGGPTPLSETLYEAYRYFNGGSVLYGNKSEKCTTDSNGVCSSSSLTTQLSVDAARTTPGGSTYKSPADSSCKANYVVFLTDGEATQDQQSNGDIATLTGASCPTSNNSSDWNNTAYNGICLAALSGYMHDNDLRPTVSGEQNVTINYIALGNDVDSAYLQTAATAGGGEAFDADDYGTLYNQLSGLLNPPSEDAATFTSPSVAVNAFNKTQVLEDLYVAMFKPSKTTHWNGNLKKFKLRNSMIVGQDTSTSAVDPDSGFLLDDSEDFWQLSTDNNDDLTTRGGAASVIPDPGTRDVYTYISSDNTPSSFVSLSSHLFNTSNSAITNSLLGTSTTCSTTVGDSLPCRDTLINWTRGDSDGSSSTANDPRHIMGDPVHSQPAVVIYGHGSTDLEKLNDAVVYVATNDGFLHAVDVESGEELWSFIPQELFSDLINIYLDTEVGSAKHYSLDGDIRVLKYDVDNDGVVDTGTGEHDRVFLYFSQGRGGDNYYALDVTDKDNPKFMWSLDGNDLGAVDKSWSTPTLGRVNTGDSSQNPQKLVLIFGGGYDNAEDAEGYIAAGNAKGNAIYMVDAVNGTVLWGQTKTSNSSAFDLMTHAIPSNVTVLDTNADGYSDRMYVGDMAGQLWRFDITNYVDNTSPVADISFSVAGGVIASLGEKGQSSPTNGAVTNNRSFYNAPDVSKIIVTGGANYYNIAIGSGDRALPKTNVTTQDFFYAIRDKRLEPMSQTAYNGLTPIKHSDLALTTGGTTGVSDPDGWALALSTSEKALAQSVTVNGVVMFTTYIPNVVSSSCNPTTGAARAYTMNLTNGTKYFTDPDTADTTDGDGLYEQFDTTGLPAQVSIVNEGNIIRTDGTTGTTTSTTSGTCLSGVTILGNCVDYGSRVKTFWQESGAN